MNVKPAHLEPVVAETGLAQPASPCLYEGAERCAARCLPIGTEGERKVQIYNKMSDQSEFTGFDDGNSSKVLNIITRVDRRRGENGTVTAGTDFVDKYQVSGRLNVFRGNQKITLTGGANNINQQPFSTQDILGVMGGGGVGGGRRGGGPGFIGRQSGLNKPISLGLNYTNVISKKLTISGSYFFNKQDNLTKTISSIENTATFGDTLNRPKYDYQLSNSTNVKAR